MPERKMAAYRLPLDTIARIEALTAALQRRSRGKVSGRTRSPGLWAAPWPSWTHPRRGQGIRHELTPLARGRPRGSRRRPRAAEPRRPRPPQRSKEQPVGVEIHRTVELQDAAAELRAEFRDAVAQLSAVVADTGEVVALDPRVICGGGQATAVGLELPADLSFAEWQGISHTLQGVNRSLMWWIGDWLRFGEQRWGEMYVQVVDETGKAYQTVTNAKWVAECFGDLSRRREDLSWKHHAEVAAEDGIDADGLLDLAERDGLSTRELRAEVNRRKAAKSLGVAESGTDVTADLWRLVEGPPGFPGSL